MWLILFFMAWAQAPAAPASSTLDYTVYKAKIEPLLLEKRPGHARCVVCHSTGTNFRLQPLSPGQKAWTDEQSQKNFQMVSRFVLPGVPTKSRFLVMALAHEAGGVGLDDPDRGRLQREGGQRQSAGQNKGSDERFGLHSHSL